MTEVRNLRSLLQSLGQNTGGDTVTVRDLLDAVGRRSYGPLLLMLGFVAISPLTIIPGGTWLISLIILLVAGQIVIGRSYPWVPRRILNVEFKREHLEQGLETADHYAAFVDRFVKPRLAFLTATPFAQLVALICVAAALISFPLGFIPLGPVLPGLAVLVFGLGLAARDGVVIALAGALLVAATFLLIRLWNRVGDVVSGLFG